MDRPLIGVEDLETPAWASGYESVATDGFVRVARTVPGTAAEAVRWGWRAAPRLTALTAVVQLLSGVVSAFGLLATADVFTRLLADRPTPERVLDALPAIAVVVVAAAARGLLEAAVGAMEGALAPRVERAAIDRLVEAVAQVELVAFDDADFAELVDRVSMMGPARIRQAVRGTGDLLASTVAMATAVVTAGLLHLVLAPVVVLAALPQGWAAVRSVRVSFASFVRMSSNSRRLDVVTRLLTGRDPAGEVRTFGLGGPLLEEHRRIARDITAEEVRVSRVQTRVRLAGRALSGLGSAVAFSVLGLLLYIGQVNLALAGAAVITMGRAGAAVSSTVYAANIVYETTFVVEMYRRCLAEAASRRRVPPTPHPGPETGRSASGPAEIRLEEVTFRYPGQDEPAVDRLSATLRRGQVIALVGENGSGKSTLAKLLTGLYLPTEGRVTWDGADTAAAEPAELFDRVAVVQQDPVRWPMTAGNNVRAGRLDLPDPDDVHLSAAAVRSGADAVVGTLPGGWSTVVSREFQGGRDLSGGQWQRISVARGLYRDATVVVADEPTAALDARAEHAVFASLHGLGGGEKITVLVTHRLANVRHADLILVLERGRLVERGTHAELMGLGGVYRELFALQASAYVDGG